LKRCGCFVFAPDQQKIKKFVFLSLKYAIAVYDPAFVVFLRMLVTLTVCLCLWRWVKRFQYKNGDWKYLLSLVCIFCRIAGSAAFSI